MPRLKAAGIRFLHGDVRRPEDLEGLEPRVIVECSAEPSVLAGYDSSPDYLVHTNLIGAYHCFELARRARADVIFLSTSRDEDTKDRKADVRVYISDLGTIERIHRWRPRRGPQAVIEDITGWIAAYENQLRPILAGEN